MPKKPAPKKQKESKLYRFRSAVTGKFVSVWFALRHPKTTVRERREP